MSLLPVLLNRALVLRTRATFPRPESFEPAALESALGFASGALSTGFHYAAQGEGPEGLALVDPT